jgi:predicted 2-oxoglutarate/Fe(II)-dependent dioxygenase YbiX
MQSVLHINPLNYSVWNELGFLVQPMLKTVITPTLNRYLSGMTDEQVKDMAMQFADAFVEQARTKGSVNLFGLDVGPKSFEGLKAILTAKLGQS